MTTGTNWEFKVLLLGMCKTADDQASALNALGAVGWEVYIVLPNAWTLLRRPLAAPAST